MRSLSAKLLSAMAFVSALALNHAAYADDVVRVGIAQFGRHPQLDLVSDSFKDQLAKEGYKEGTDITYNLKQVNFDPSLVPQMIGQILSQKPKLILTITTPVSQGAKAILQNTDVPGVFAAVSDPVQARLVPSWDGGDKNMTGASDLQDVEAVLQFTRELLPDAKRLGVPYNPGEDNDIAVLQIIHEKAAKYGFEVVEMGIETVNDVPVRIAAFKRKADVIYVMTSNLLQPAEPAIAAAAGSIRLPVISANDANVRAGNFLASFSVDYGNVGRNAAKIAARIIKGEKPETIAVIKPAFEDHKPVVSAKQMALYGLEVPASLASCGCTLK